MSDDAHVSVRDLTTYYDDSGPLGPPPVRAVDGVRFDIRRGETFGVVGESGCGKTTLGRTLLGLESPDDGSVVVDGRDVTDLSGRARRAWQRDAGMVFQDPEESLNDRMTVGEIVREPLDAHDWETPAARRERVFEFLDRVGLREEHYYRYPHQFSGGQRQRVGIARALVLDPGFLVLDEPVSALDVSVQARIINLLDDLQAELGLTYLFIAHDLAVVRHICDRVAVMYLGEFVERGPTEAVFTDPAHPYTASLLSSIPGDRTAGAAADRERVALRGTPPSPRYPPDGCRFATRCPARVRPDEHADLDDEAWTAVAAFRDLLRARARDGGGLVDRVARRLGLSDDVDVARTETFDGVTLSASARDAVERATDRARAGDDDAAVRVLAETFGSVCERDPPAAHDVGEGRVSRCVRHDAGYEDVAPVVEARESDR